jgi:hypothetical protein
VNWVYAPTPRYAAVGRILKRAGWVRLVLTAAWNTYIHGDGKITNDHDLNEDGKVTLADWERGAYIVVNSWAKKWSRDGKIFLLYSAMIDPTWKRGNYLGRIEVRRYLPRMTLRLKLACNDRSNLRTTIGLSDNPQATEPEHSIAPEVLNGWPIFGRSGPGHVPLAGPQMKAPLELGVDLTPLLDKLGRDQNDKAKLFLHLLRADGSNAEGELHEAAVRTCDAKGRFVSEQPFASRNGTFGEHQLHVSRVVDEPKSAQHGH